MTGKSEQPYLEHALMCVQRIFEYTRGGESEFLADQKTQDAVLRNLEVIGHCIKDQGLETLQSRDPAIEWRAIAAFRDVLPMNF